MTSSQPSSPVRKAIFPIAGIGSRFLPLTLAVSKEMIPIIDTPLLHYAVAEALEAGVEECVFVIASGGDQRRVIEDYFCDNGALERRLESAGKGDQAAAWNARLPRPKSLRFIEQERPLGLGHAVWLAREVIGNESFALLLPDELLFSEPGCLRALVEAHGNERDGFLLAMQQVPHEACHRYGILDVGGIDIGNEPVALHGLVEKPAPKDAPSNLAIIGRYLLPASIFPLLAPSGQLHDGEDTPLTDALAALIEQDAPTRGLLFSGERYDCGDKGGLLAATLACAAKRDDLVGARAMLEKFLQRAAS